MKLLLTKGNKEIKKYGIIKKTPETVEIFNSYIIKINAFVYTHITLP